MIPITDWLRSLRAPSMHIALGIIFALIAALGLFGGTSSTPNGLDVVQPLPTESTTEPTTETSTTEPTESSTIESDPSPEPSAEPEPTTEPEPELVLPPINNREEILKAGLSQRGEQIGTGGKPAIALRFDHHLEDFHTKVLPLLKKYNLPWGQMINAERIGTSESMDYPELASMTHNNGGEIWNHGWSHTSIYTTDEADREIAQGLQALKTGLPTLWIDGWAQPGQSEYLGLNGTPFTPEHYSDTYPGRLVIDQHAFVRGYYPNPYHPLTGDHFIGQSHVTIDRQTGEKVNAYVRRAVSSNTGVTLMLHPNYLDEPGYLSTGDLNASLAYIARLRDEDKIEVLSNTGILMANQDLPEDFGNLLNVVPSHEINGKWNAGVPRALNHLGVPHEAEVWVSGEGTAYLSVDVQSGSYPVAFSRTVELTDVPQRLSVIVTPPLDATSVTVTLEGNLNHDGLTYQPL